jgi:hypothetical protein
MLELVFGLPVILSQYPCRLRDLIESVAEIRYQQEFN